MIRKDRSVDRGRRLTNKFPSELEFTRSFSPQSHSLFPPIGCSAPALFCCRLPKGAATSKLRSRPIYL